MGFGTAMLIAAGALLGVIFGSFIATIVIRWPQGRSVARGRSACDHCGTALGPARLVPILSYAVQRGRAACCGGRIDPVHPLTELLAAAIGVVSVVVAPDLPQAIVGALFGWLLLALAMLDLRHFWLPNALTGTLAAAGLAVGLAGFPPDPIDRMAGGAAGFLLLEAVRFGYRRLRGREGMGGGDPKLFGAIGLWLGWHMLPLVLLGGALAGLAAALLLLLAGHRLGATSRLPFGPFLALAAWGVWIAGAAGTIAG
ncbi:MULTISPECIES: prepilin peptidase [unclassified Sphingomonas]|uniref:prepilin peptidase n=2 Tax=Sphingomonas TaxID=13687 RepID=UPI0006FC04BB|nr:MULTISPECIES: A24 family peptidase [unclassified Sphingomonas]KQX19580.1 peptidase A24 [Sphingomonas sp. Root1294]KQY65781.1 peptidase A24 [Sphingomonas sp. Root50]KRB94913.1 peptidase A24 [Sphingomonas sp. Root720]